MIQKSALFFLTDHFSGARWCPKSPVMRDPSPVVEDPIDSGDVGDPCGAVAGTVKILLGAKETVDVTNSLYTTGLKVS